LVLVPTAWQRIVPAYNLNAQPASSAGMLGSGLTDKDIENFYASTLYTEATVKLIAVPVISFVVLPSDSYLNEQFQAQPQFFTRRYSNERYVLYQVIQKPVQSDVVVGLTQLSQKQWN